MNDIPTTPQEEEAWTSIEFAREIQTRNRAATQAWEAAAQYLVEHANQLGHMSLRRALEEGFMLGYYAALKEK